MGRPDAERRSPSAVDRSDDHAIAEEAYRLFLLDRPNVTDVLTYWQRAEQKVRRVRLDSAGASPSTLN